MLWKVVKNLPRETISAWKVDLLVIYERPPLIEEGLSGYGLDFDVKNEPIG